MDNVRRFLVMQAGGQQYGLPMEQIAEVGSLRTLSAVPRAPAWCMGASRSAGTVVAVIDLAAYMGDEPEQHPENLVVLDLGSGGVGLQVGRVQSLVLADGVQLVEDATGRWLTASHCTAELLDASELIQEITAAMSR